MVMPFAGRNAFSLPLIARLAGGSLPTFVVSEPTPGEHAHRQPTRTKRSPRAQEQDQAPGPHRRPAEAGGLHPRVHAHAEEAELGSSEGGTRSVDERLRSHDLHPR